MLSLDRHELNQSLDSPEQCLDEALVRRAGIRRSPVSLSGCQQLLAERFVEDGDQGFLECRHVVGGDLPADFRLGREVVWKE